METTWKHQVTTMFPPGFHSGNSTIPCGFPRKETPYAPVSGIPLHGNQGETWGFLHGNQGGNYMETTGFQRETWGKPQGNSGFLHENQGKLHGNPRLYKLELCKSFSKIGLEANKRFRSLETPLWTIKSTCISCIPCCDVLLWQRKNTPYF